jgi:protein-tyrosine-phosphatase
LSLTPFAGLILDYFRIREEYFEAVRAGSAHRIEAVDMGRRGLHDDAAELLTARLAGKVEMDHETARRLFTLLCSVQPYAARIDPRDTALPLVLFVCTMNAIRSPMAAALARHAFPAEVISRSAGLSNGAVDGFVHEVMDEIGVDMSAHTPHTLEELAALNFDLIVSLSQEAADAVATRRIAASATEYWDVPDPSRIDGTRAQRLAAYRDLRDRLDKKVRDRLSPLVAGGSQSV